MKIKDIRKELNKLQSKAYKLEKEIQKFKENVGNMKEKEIANNFTRLYNQNHNVQSKINSMIREIDRVENKK